MYNDNNGKSEQNSYNIFIQTAHAKAGMNIERSNPRGGKYFAREKKIIYDFFQKLLPSRFRRTEHFVV